MKFWDMNKQKKYYNTLGDNQKLEYLKQVKEINEKAMAQKRALQLQTINPFVSSECALVALINKI